jgi:AbrB family looped-hinge helix DNA binding protein
MLPARAALRFRPSRITISLSIIMQTVTVSPKFQVVIPLAVRQAMGLKPGQKIQVIQLGNRIELIPVVKAKKLRGFLKGIDTTIERDDDRL